MDDQTSWQKQLLVGLVLLLVVGALLGGIVGLAGIKAANLAGVGSTTTSSTSGPRLHVPRNAQTPTTALATTTAPSSSATTTTRPPRTPPASAFTLAISQTTVSTYERIDLTGTYHAPDGTSLQVQRRENGVWVDFPTTATVNGGSFTTYVQTGHTGVNRFRMTDTSSGRSSDVATVTVK